MASTHTTTQPETHISLCATSRETTPFALIPEDSRITTLPIPPSRSGLWAWYKDACRAYWTPQEVSLADDVMDYKIKLTADEKHFVNHVLAFFATADSLVNENLAKRFTDDVRIYEAGRFYEQQMAMENIHAWMYSEMLYTIIPDEDTRRHLIDAINTIPAVGKMAAYMRATIASDAPLAERLLRMACVEGIFFTGCFCAIYWLKKRGLMPGLCLSNELIARDEALHTMFAMYLYDMLRPEHKLTQECVHAILSEAVDIGGEFIKVALPVRMPEMNADLMVEYIQSRADDLATLIAMAPPYGVRHGFDFMEKQNYTYRTNFFERRVSEYSKPVTADKKAFEVNYSF